MKLRGEIYYIARDIWLYRDGDRFLPLYAESMSREGNHWYEVEVGGMREWHLSKEIITGDEKEKILSDLQTYAEQGGARCVFVSRSNSQVEWDPSWDKSIQKHDAIEALPYQFKLNAWYGLYKNGALSVKIPIIKPQSVQESRIIRFVAPRDWEVLNREEGKDINYGLIQGEVRAWSQIIGLAIDFSQSLSEMSNPLPNASRLSLPQSQCNHTWFETREV